MDPLTRPDQPLIDYERASYARRRRTHKATRIVAIAASIAFALVAIVFWKMPIFDSDMTLGVVLTPVASAGAVVCFLVAIDRIR